MAGRDGQAGNGGVVLVGVLGEAVGELPLFGAVSVAIIAASGTQHLPVPFAGWRYSARYLNLTYASLFRSVYYSPGHVRSPTTLSHLISRSQ